MRKMRAQVPAARRARWRIDLRSLRPGIPDLALFSNPLARGGEPREQGLNLEFVAPRRSVEGVCVEAFCPGH